MTHDGRLVRFVVAVQRRPVVAASCGYALLVLAGFPVGWVRSDRAAFAFVLLATCWSSTIAAIGTQAASGWTRAGVIGVGVGTTLPLCWLALAESNLYLTALIAVVVVLPHATIRLQGWLHRAPGAACTVLHTIAAVFSPLLIGFTEFTKNSAALAMLSLWLVTVQAAFHTAASRSIAGRLAVPCALVCGAVSGLVFAEASRRSGQEESVAAQAVAWGLAALLLPIARTNRSLTAVPFEHPIFTEYGGPAARAPD